MARASLVRARRRVRSCVLDSLVHLQQCNLTVKRKKNATVQLNSKKKKRKNFIVW